MDWKLFRWIDKVLELALVTLPVPLPEDEVVVTAAPVVADPVPAGVLQESVKH
jgi:hypothetical protein